jgi:ABC-type glycerol-3-phosphate transport system permease component
MAYWFYGEEGKQVGPVSEEELAAQFRNGRSLKTLVWSQGMAEWKSAADVPAFAPPGSVPPPVPDAGPAPGRKVRKALTDPWTKQDLLEVAKFQKYIQWLVLAYLVAMFIPFGQLIVGVVGIYFIYKLAVALRSSFAWLYIVAMFIPIIGLLALLHIVVGATRILRTNGVRVGIMGAKLEDI